MNELKRIITIHRNLLKLIISESKKKKPINLHTRFFLHLGKEYCRVMINEYKNLFLILDPIYRKRLSERNKYNRLKTDLHRAIKMLQLVDRRMKEQGFPRWKTQQFWRDFWKNGQVRVDVFEDLLKEIK